MYSRQHCCGFNGGMADRINTGGDSDLGDIFAGFSLAQSEAPRCTQAHRILQPLWNPGLVQSG